MLVPVILSGGSGTRLWPVSRESNPKPFMKVGGGESLLRKTFDRASALPGATDVITVTNREYFHKTRDEYGREGGPGTYILEPFGRNTAPAIAIAALEAASKHGEDAVLVVLPADHLIQDRAAFLADVAAAEALAREGFLVTFGVPPDRPEIGYGYLELGEAISSSPGFRVARFVEKPYLEVARKFVAGGAHLWNSGMFCFTAGVLLEAIARHQPALLDAVRACWKASAARIDLAARVVEVDPATFVNVADISIDFAVMEKAKNVAAIRARFDWSDIGSWSAVHEAIGGDATGNTVVGEAILVDVTDSYLHSEGRLVAAVGIDGLIVVDTPDALLVADRRRAQDVKKVVEQLKLRQHETAVLHRTVARPWGAYTVLEQGDGFKIKRIVIKPGQSLSLQFHRHRSEHWVVVTGAARVTHNEKVFILGSNESTFIPAGHRHRLENPGAVDLVMIEVQSGDYLGEDDITRLDDNYGRK